MAQDYTSFRPTTTHTNTTGKTIYTSGNSGSNHGTILQKGQILRGQITNITAREITLLLENGQSLTARYDNALELLIGDSASFRVLSSDEQGILLRAMMGQGNSRTMADTTILKALESAALPVTERNISLVSSLLKYNLPIHAPMLNHILQQSFHNPDISLPHLVAMNHMGLPIEPETTRWFENYCNLEHQLLPEFHAVAREALVHLDELLTSSTSTAAKYAHTLLAIPNGNRLVLSGTNQPAAPTSDLIITTSDLTIQASTTLSAEQFSLETVAASLSAITDESTPTQPVSAQLQDFLNMLQEWQLPDGLTLDMNSPNPRNLIRVLQTILSTDKMLPHTENGIRHILKHPYFEKLVTDLFLTSWTLSPEELLQKDAVKQLYERIQSQLSQLEEVLHNTGASVEKQSSLQQTRQNLQFLGTLNELYTYIQLPLQMTGGQTHGDLYVYTNRQAANKNPKDSFSCLLHLNMSRLGALDIRVRMESGQVKTLFYTEDTSTATLIEAHLSELDEAVSRHGIPMTTQVIRHKLRASSQNEMTKEDSSFLQNILEAEEPSAPIHRYSFDVRA